MELVACFDGLATCAITEACVLRSIPHEALKAFLSELDRYSLADLVATRALRKPLAALSAADSGGTVLTR